MAKSDSPFRWFEFSPDVTQMMVMLYARFPLSLRNVEGLGAALLRSETPPMSC
jgi:transposase-like protein